MNNKIGKFRCDLLIENKVIVELKAINGFLPKIFDLQLLSYLKNATAMWAAPGSAGDFLSFD